jgi:hypothetical protein
MKIISTNTGEADLSHATSVFLLAPPQWNKMFLDRNLVLIRFHQRAYNVTHAASLTLPMLRF